MRARIDRLVVNPAGETTVLRGEMVEGASLDDPKGIAELPEGWTDLDRWILVPELALDAQWGARQLRR